MFRFNLNRYGGLYKNIFRNNLSTNDGMRYTVGMQFKSTRNIPMSDTLKQLYDQEPPGSNIMTDVPGPKTKEYLYHLGRYQDTRTAELVMNERKSFGNYFVDTDGNTFLDFHSMIGSIAIGYNNPVFRTQLDNETLLSIVNRPALGVFPPECLLPAVEKIMGKAPDGLNKLFLSMSGSGVNEIAFKMAFMKYRRDQRGGDRFTEKELESSLVNAEPGSPNLSILSFTRGYHGKLLGTLSATHSNPIYKVDIPSFDWPIAPFPELRYPLDDPKNIRYNRDEEDLCLGIVERIIETNKVPVAGLIIEPIQAVGGDNHASPRFFQRLREITKKHNVTFIVDEVQTGVGATGKFWAHEHWNLPSPPDIITFAKKMQAAGVYYRDEYLASHPLRNFNTWMGNPFDILKAGIIIDYIDDNDLIQRVGDIGGDFVNALKNVCPSTDIIEKEKGIENIRGMGSFIAFDVKDRQSRDQLIEWMKREGVIVNGCGERTIRLRPMLIYDHNHMNQFIQKLVMWLLI